MPASANIGTELAGYRLEALIGRGGMGVVYRAHDLALDRDVALKLLAPDLADDVSFRERFLRESRLAASLEHPNVVPIHDAGEIDGQLYIAMRLVYGTDLKAVLRDGPLEPARAVRVLEQVAGALDAAHERGLVHRDVKPSNVLVTDEDHVYLADFGLTRRLGEAGSSPGAGQSLGTVDYVAPEQIRGEEIDGRADLYSLGCLLHECLTGAPPFRRSSDAAALFAHLEESPPTAPGLEAVAPTALAKEPGDRYASGRELVEATRSALGLAAPRRYRWPLVLAGLGLVLIVAAFLAFFLVRGSTGAATTGRVVRIEAATGKVAGTVRVGNDPGAIAAGPGSVWVANFGDSTVSKVDLATSRVETIAVNGPPLSLGVSEGVVLVASGPPANSLTLIRARGGSAYDIVPLQARPAGATSLVATGPAGVWVVDKERWTVAHVSLRGGNDFRVVAQRRLTLRHPLAELNGVAVGKDALWLAGNTVDRRLLKLDPQTARVVATVRLSVAPRRVAIGEGAVWVTGEIDNVVLRIDPRANREVARIPIGRGGGGISAGAGSVWVADELDSTITRIDPNTNRVAETIRVGGSPHDLVVADGEVWVAKGQK